MVEGKIKGRMKGQGTYVFLVWIFFLFVIFGYIGRWTTRLIVVEFWYANDALLSSLMDSNVSLKWKQRKSKDLEECSLVRSTLGVKGRAGAPKWD
jgi:hypothetical protein